MTHQYETEVLNKLMERDGINIPSSVPPYEAEIKGYLINQVKQAYPKLTDYEAEWLLYNYTKHLPADFPISSVSNVTEASFENVVPFAYQSAILKGNTFVNLIESCNVIITSTSSKSLKYTYGRLDHTKSYLLQYRVNQLPELSDTSDTGRVLKFEWYNDSTSKSHLNVYNKDLAVGKNNTHIIEPYTGNVTKTNFGIYCPNYVSGILDIDIIIIEYHQDMENWDIPYFDGMASVKMPVLTTIGKNLFDVSKATRGYITSTGEINGSISNVKSDYIKINPSDNYSVKSWGALIGGNFSFYDNNKNFILRTPTVSTTTSPTNASYMIFHTQYVRSGEVDLNNVEITIIKGTIIPTIFEPFKSNIITVNEEVELRGIGDVKDELDLMTGEVTERIGESNSENFARCSYSSTLFNGYYAAIIDLNNKASSPVIKANLVPTQGFTDGLDCGIYSNPGNVVLFKKGATLEEIKNLVNNLIIQYQLAEESIKTVDLKTVNESGESIHFMPLEGTMHVQSSGEIIQPTFDMSVPVEATTQNLASFID